MENEITQAHLENFLKKILEIQRKYSYENVGVSTQRREEVKRVLNKLATEIEQS